MIQPRNFCNRYLNEAVIRIFDIMVASLGIIIIGIPVALLSVGLYKQLDGKLIYRQKRVGKAGEEFILPKIRTIDSSHRNQTEEISGLAQWMRATHLDEFPQLFLVLNGKMSVVGPRPLWVAEDAVFEKMICDWEERRSEKPGMTGLAQIYDYSASQPRLLIKKDLSYLNKKSVFVDIIVCMTQLNKSLFNGYEVAKKVRQQKYNRSFGIGCWIRGTERSPNCWFWDSWEIILPN